MSRSDGAREGSIEGRRAFFPVSLNLDGRICVVIGKADDREAIEKSVSLEEAGAEVRRICEWSSLRDDEVVDAFFVISTPQDAGLSERLRALADRHRFLLCCIDQPRYGFVAMAAIAKAGPVRVAISTAGLAPRVGKALKNALQRAMDEKFARFIERLAEKRARTREDHPNPEDSPARRGAMIEAARGFEAEVRFAYPSWFEENDAER
jgi:siroheme synthase (precorrin-2 oxidase/ferrochelatase)